MGGHFPPAKLKDVQAVLNYLGYTARPQAATSHVNWVKGEGCDFRKVTVDANNAPFKDQALTWLLHQMGIRKKDFYGILAKL